MVTTQVNRLKAKGYRKKQCATIQTKLRTFEKYLIYFSLQLKHLSSYKKCST